MPSILLDEALRSRLDVHDSFLDREDWTVVTAKGDWVGEARELRPELVVFAHEPGGNEAVTVVKALQSVEPGASQRRIICVLDEATYTRHCDFLVRSGIACLVGDVDSDLLIAAMTQLLNVPTRVNVRVKVVFELQGRDQSDELFRGRMLDISTGGFCFESQEQFEKGAMLYSFFSLGRDEPVIFTSGRIVRASGVPGGVRAYGVEFQDVRVEDRRRIADFIFRHCAGETPYRTQGAVLVGEVGS